jgi:CheY-like chemotaxis protein
VAVDSVTRENAFVVPTDGEPIEILLAEDNPGDVRLTEKALDHGKILNNLHVVNNGVEAIKFLRQEGEYADEPHPDLVLLDLNMPKKDGREVLEDIQADPELRRIPVVVLTSSGAEEDVVRSYELNANAYLTKPVDFEGFVDIVGRIEDFWFSVVKMPPK